MKEDFPDSFEDQERFNDSIIRTPRDTWAQPVLVDEEERLAYHSFLDDYQFFLESHQLPPFETESEKKRYMEAVFEKKWGFPLPWMNGGMGVDFSNDTLVNAVLDSGGVGTLSGISAFGEEDVFDELYNNDDAFESELESFFSDVNTGDDLRFKKSDLESLSDEPWWAVIVDDVLTQEGLGLDQIHNQLIKKARKERRDGLSQKGYYRQKNKEIYEQRIQSVREQHPHGIVAVNLMRIIDGFDDTLDHIGEIGRDDPSKRTDIVLVGAGIDKKLGQKMQQYPHMKYGIIVSAASLGIFLDRISERKEWPRPAFIYIENPVQAGGHLGAKTPEDAQNSELFNTTEIIEEIKKYDPTIPVVLAGGIVDRDDVQTAYDDGYDGVSLGTRMLLTQESGMSEDLLKKYYLNDDYDVVTGALSPTGFPSRYIENPEFERKRKENIQEIKSRCIQCLGAKENCGFLQDLDSYCIAYFLSAARQGKDWGLLFTGALLEKLRTMDTYLDDDGETYVPTVAEVCEEIFGKINRTILD